MPKLNISVCVLGLNEEKNLKACLESVKDWAKEIMVGVDDQSTDKTYQVAGKYTNKVLVLPHVDMFHKNKQKVMDKATQKWVLWLDADEVVSKELVKEIRKTVSQKNVTDSYLIPRKNFIFNKWIKYSGWYPDLQLRLWKRGKVSWPGKSIHEDPITSGSKDQLSQHIIHNNYTSVSQYLIKLNQYTSLDAKRRRKEFKSPYLKYLIVRPIDEFIKRLIALKGYKDGLHGLALAMLQGFYELIVVIKVWEMDKFRQEEIDLVKEVEKQGKNILASWNWWKRELKIKETGNKLKQGWHKGLRKLGF
ncbi:glycosyltransferase family 2 protein [Patescibacteria group bacterium]